MKIFFALLLSVLSVFQLTADSSDPAAPAAPAKRVLTKEGAKQAAVFAVAFEKIPDSVYDEVSGVLTCKNIGKDSELARLSVMFISNGRTYAGVEFISQDKDGLIMRGYELESLEPEENDSAKITVRVGEKDAISTEYIEFKLSEIEKIVKEKFPVKQEN